MLEAALNLIVIGTLSWLIWKGQPDTVRRFFWPALTVKLLAGIALGLVYTYYYSVGDTFTLFNEAREQAGQFYEHPSAFVDFLFSAGGEQWKGNLRASFFVKLVSVVSIATFGNYWITSLWFSFISFLGAWHLFRLIVHFFSDSEYAAAAAFLFFPSVVFWSAGIIKESISVAGLFMLAAVWLKVIMRERILFWEWAAAPISIWILWSLKYYWLAIFVPVAALSVFIHFTDNLLLTRWKYALWTSLIILSAAGVRFIHPNFYPGYFLHVLIENHDAFIPISAPDNLIHYHELKPAWGSVLLNAPWALFSGLFRPLPGEAHGMLAVIPAIENLVLLVLLVSSLNFSHVKGTREPLMVISVLVYSLILCVFLAISTPNLGSLARYKVGFMPFLILVILYHNPLLRWLARKILK